ncbi:DUF4194 domain-containing protein [Salinisphaera sp.]|uniref:DUF4194 domain-containing protein n=1 Tax=Salinisphaera sp. TaxID=1914330 RepID=UPI002D76D7DE|nr:DUF4194 domain-containing protein [Salinisphaera sp.]HET7313781.1 DUF4194 domain-containing protein [Salinisphaera sp.]
MSSSTDLSPSPADADAPLPADGLSPVVISLCRGVLHRDAAPRDWQTLLDLAPRVRDYVAVLNLELMIDEAEGHAYLAQRPADENAETDLPRLISRRQLSYPVSLLLALLRKKLAEHDATSGEPRLIVTREQIVDALRVFLPDAANEARLLDRIDTHINKAVELGMLRRLRASGDGASTRFEVQRIIKAFVDAQWLNELEARLAEYRAYIDPEASTASRSEDG